MRSRHAEDEPLHDPVDDDRSRRATEGGAKYTLPYFQVQRAKIALLAAEVLTSRRQDYRLALNT